MLLGLTAITALCMAPPVRAETSPAPGQSSASRKPPHGGGSGGGLPYATASTLNQLIADLNYANSVGGAITINLAPGTTFDLTSADNSTDGGNGLPVIGATKAVALTIIGNDATLKRIGGGIYNSGGTLTASNGSALSDNAAYHADYPWTGGDGGGLYNGGGTVTVENFSSITGNAASDLGADVYNLSVLYWMAPARSASSMATPPFRSSRVEEMRVGAETRVRPGPQILLFSVAGERHAAERIERSNKESYEPRCGWCQNLAAGCRRSEAIWRLDCEASRITRPARPTSA